jgi:hypothetical protein
MREFEVVLAGIGTKCVAMTPEVEYLITCGAKQMANFLLQFGRRQKPVRHQFT